MSCFNFEASTFSQQHPYHYNDLDRRPERKNYPPPPTSKTRKSNRFICYNCRQYGHYAAECTFLYVSKIKENSDPNFTESLDDYFEDQDFSSGESYYEYNSDDKESEETEEETDINFFDQETFYQQPLGQM
ncbi:hypothetical protein F8M41_015361 [Gigaspora margarita]|uniref:CCHC-type domain-containing protein n=1 Tax=Gigaspora margarita TaxID=4874 RepID=A0A8H4EUY2_GIGMA|nr:hypothetical protein F8M41_015361 [Gigaspora margarita]